MIDEKLQATSRTAVEQRQVHRTVSVIDGHSMSAIVVQDTVALTVTGAMIEVMCHDIMIKVGVVIQENQ